MVPSNLSPDLGERSIESNRTFKFVSSTDDPWSDINEELLRQQPKDVLPLTKDAIPPPKPVVGNPSIPLTPVTKAILEKPKKGSLIGCGVETSTHAGKSSPVTSLQLNPLPGHSKDEVVVVDGNKPFAHNTNSVSLSAETPPERKEVPPAERSSQKANSCLSYNSYP